MTFDVAQVRQDFPILHQAVHEHPLVYLDNAATTQKPRQVIAAMTQYYQHDNANVHRSVHALSARATAQYELAREKVRRFIGAPHAHECIFVRNTTEAINLVAQSFVAPQLQAGDEILITYMEHHANIVPWQMICQKTGAKLVVAPISHEGEVLLEAFASKISAQTKFVAINYASNAIGTINPVKEMIAMAHAQGVCVLLDGAQATAHLEVNLQELGCDFYAFSGHKMYAPTGIGVLWGKTEHLTAMPPYQGGGEMIAQVSFEHTEYAPLPNKFEAGTPDIAGVIGLGAAIDYLQTLTMSEIAAYETMLLAYAKDAMAELQQFRVIGQAAHKVPIISFVHAHVHAHDVGTILDSQGVAVRSGHHCAMPLMAFYDVAATTRMSLSFYNTIADIDRFIAALHMVEQVFA